MDRLATYDFLLVIVGLPRTVSETNGNFRQKSQIFPILCIFNTPGNGVRWWHGKKS